MSPPNYFYWFRIDNKHMTEPWLDQAQMDLAYTSACRIPQSNAMQRQSRDAWVMIRIQTYKPSNQQRLPLYIYGFRRKDNLLILFNLSFCGGVWLQKAQKNLIPPKVNLGKINANKRENNSNVFFSFTMYSKAKAFLDNCTCGPNILIYDYQKSYGRSSVFSSFKLYLDSFSTFFTFITPYITIV